MKQIITITLLSFTIASFAQNNDAKPAAATAPTIHPAAQKTSATPVQEAKIETVRMNTFVSLGASYDKVLAANIKYFEAKAKIYNDQQRGVELTQEQKGKLRDLNEAHAKDLQAAMGKENYDKFIAAEREKAKTDSERAKERKEAAPAKK